MYCNKCGAQLAEGSVFCHKCGTKNEIVDENPKEIIQSTSNVTQLATNLEKTDMLAYGRVESENDKATNYTLFTLFGKLITPLKAYESINKKISDEKMELENTTDTGFLDFILYSIISIIRISFCIFMIIFIYLSFKSSFLKESFDDYFASISHEDKMEYFYAYKDFSGTKSRTLEELDNTNNNFKDFVNQNRDPQMVKLLKFLGTGQYNGYYEYSSPATMAFGLYGRLSPIILIVWVIYLVLAPKSDKKLKNKQREDLSLRIENDIKKQQEMLQILNQFIIYIPPNYRNSDAVAFFYDAYSNTKVDNLKEAINLYDTQQRHYEVIDNLYALQTEMMMTSAQLQQMNNKMNLLAAEIFVTAFI